MLNEWSDRQSEPRPRRTFGDIVIGLVWIGGTASFLIGIGMALRSLF